MFLLCCLPLGCQSQLLLLFLTVCFQLVCHLVDFALQSGISSELIHHANWGLLLLHLLDFSPHVALLLSVFLHHLWELKRRESKERHDLTTVWDTFCGCRNPVIPIVLIILIISWWATRPKNFYPFIQKSNICAPLWGTVMKTESTYVSLLRKLLMQWECQYYQSAFKLLKSERASIWDAG